MRCGETHIRSKEYYNKYSDEKLFSELINKETPIILDIGAHEGESVKFFKNIFKDCKIYSFEPFPEAYQKLSRLKYKNFLPINKAISSKSGNMDFYLFDKSHLNSLNKINIDSKDSIHYAKSVKAKQIEVESITLDDFIEEKSVEYIDLIKIDVQGSEKDVLIGAGKCLKNTRLITLEINLFDFYEKKSSFLEVETLLPNFELYSIIRLSQNPMNFRTDWCEAVYINKSL